MAIAQENIERIQRMEGYLNDYIKKAISNFAIIIVVRSILMIWTCPIKLTFQQIYHVVSCPKMPSMIYWTSIFRWESNSWRSQRK